MKQVSKNEYVRIESGKRVLVISDIHGGFESFKEILAEANFSPDDYLFIVGDVINRKNHGIKIIDYLIELKKTHHVHMVVGNNDLILPLIKGSKLEDLYKYIIRNQKKQVFYEIFHNYGVEVSEDFTYQEFLDYVPRIIDDYHKQIEFIENLPVTIETDKMIFAHAGIEDKPLDQQDRAKVTKWDLFYDGSYVSNKLLIVGHYPVSAYYHQISSFNPVIDLKRNIISIDGGYSVKDDGQLNLLIFKDENDRSPIHIAIDELEEVRVKKDFMPNNQQPLSLIWNQDEVKIIKKYQNHSVVSVKGTEMIIDNDFIYQTNDKLLTYDFTNYQCPVKENDIVKVVYIYDEWCFIKKDGIRGFVPRNKLDLDYLHFRLASYTDARKIANLAEEIKKMGIDNSWDEEYPNYEIFFNDYEQQALYKLSLNGEIVASISFEPPVTKSKHTIAITRFLINPKYQGQGYAKYVIANIEAKAKSLGFKAIELLAYINHPMAKEMYEHFGYTNQGLYETPWGNDYYLFKKNI